MAGRKPNPQDIIDEQNEYIAELEGSLDQIGGLTQAAPEIDSEDGLRSVLARVARIAAPEEEDGPDCEFCDDEGCEECDPEAFEEDE